MQTTTIDLESAFGSMFYISQYAFDAFVEYCTLDFKDEVAKSNVFMFLSLFPKVIEYCQPDASKDLIGEFTSFLLDRSQCGLPIVREEDRKLFLRVAEILEPCMSN
jgi:hypothetical protein